MKLSSLLQKIENYYRMALRSYQLVKEGAPSAGYYMPDTDQDEVPGGAPTFDEGEYPDLVQAAQQVSDPNLSSELMLIAEMYKKAIEIGGGYNSINRAISNVMNMYLEDEDDPQQAAIEDLLNNVVRDLRMRAGGTSALNKPDSPQVIAQLKKFKDEYNDRAVQEELDDLSQFDDKATQVFDPTGGMGREEAQKGSGRGYSVKTVKSLKDWVEHYRNEQQRYLELFAQDTNKNIKSKVSKILEILPELIAKTSQANALQQELANNPDPNKDAQLQTLLAEIKSLKEKRTQARQSIRRDMFLVENEKLANEIKSSPNERAKFLAEQKMELNKTLASQDKNKGEEIKLRTMLIKSMSGGNALGQDTLKKLLQKIQEAAALRISIEDIRKEQAKNIKEKFNISNTYKYEGGKEVSMRSTAKDIDGLIIQFRQSIASIKMGIKKKITADLKSKEHADFEPYLKNIEAAKNALKNASPENKATADKQLKNAEAQLLEVLNDKAEKHPDIERFKEHSAGFVTFIKNLQNLLNGKSEIPVSDLVIEGNNLIMKEQNRIGKGKDSKLIDALKTMVMKLQSGQIVPNKEASGEIKMNAEKRKQVLLELMKRANDKQMADDVNLASIEDPKQYAEAVFDKMLENLQIEGLDF